MSNYRDATQDVRLAVIFLTSTGTTNDYQTRRRIGIED